MAQHLPVVEVLSLSDVERLATHGGPSRIVLVRADSICDARAILSMLRAKGIMLKEDGSPYVFPDYHFDDTSEDSHGSSSDGDLAWRGWLAEHKEDVDVGDILKQIVSDHEGPAAAMGAHHHHHDVVAHGWVVNNRYPFCRTIDLGILLEEMVAEVLPLLVRDPADASALRRLRTLARKVRRVGKELPSLMGQAPVTLANHLNNVVAGALRRGIGGAEWMASRCGKLLVRVLSLYEDDRVSFH